jgi:hypothetical protein
MTRTTLIATAACALSAAAFLAPAQAAPAHGLATSKAIPAQTLVDKVGYRRRCWRANAVCRDRWGWGWRYQRCMARRGC